MKTPKTAQQFLEHYLWEYFNRAFVTFDKEFHSKLLTAMRAYKNYKLDQEYENIRKEAVENVEFQYGVSDLPLYTLTRKWPDYYRASSHLVWMEDCAMFDEKTPWEAMRKLTDYLKSKNLI